jgi:[ribosomal protein S5]-alanine N-acetyltransferase
VLNPPDEIANELLRLRGLTLADADGPYLKWMNDPDIVRFTESRFRNHSAADIRDYITAILRGGLSVFLAIEDRQSGRHVGNIKLGPIDWVHRSADVGLIIGEKDYWGRGFGSAAIECLSHYAFKNLCLRKLTAGIYAPNIGCLKAFLKAGYNQEGLRRSQCLLDDMPIDVILVGRVNTDSAA